MPLINIAPLWRNRFPFAWRFAWKTTGDTPHLSDKIARDIGIDPQTLAQLRHTWPSQSLPQAQQDHLVRHVKGR